MILACSFLCFAYTGLLLVFHARSSRGIPLIVLAMGFFFAAGTIVAHAITFPGLFVPPNVLPLWSTPATVGLLWLTWRAGLLVAMLAFLWFARSDPDDPRMHRQARAFIVAIGISFFVLTALGIWVPGVPSMVSHGHWSPFFFTVLAPIIVALALGVIVAVGRSLNRATILDLCLAIVSIAVLMDGLLMVLGEHAFTVGWYASRAMSLFGATVVLGVLLRRESEMYASLLIRAEVLEGEAHTDTLTGLPNRRRFDEEYVRAVGSALRRSSSLALAIIDIDRFKLYNDAFGHQAGDEALAAIAQAIADSVDRSGDFAARYGGEEFVVILEDTTLEGAVGVAERIRNAVLEAGIRAPSGGLLSVSVGVAERRPGERASDLIANADQAMYRAKRSGRNRVSAFRTDAFGGEREPRIASG
jgi:diguanylate cyclase (GGDEF)-like protein